MQGKERAAEERAGVRRGGAEKGWRVFTEPAPSLSLSPCLLKVSPGTKTGFSRIVTEKETQARRDCVEEVTQRLRH